MFVQWCVFSRLLCWIISVFRVFLLNVVMLLLVLKIVVMLFGVVFMFELRLKGYCWLMCVLNGLYICVFQLWLILFLVGFISVMKVWVSGCSSSGCSVLCWVVFRLVNICLLIRVSVMFSLEFLLLKVFCISLCVFMFSLFWFLMLFRCVCSLFSVLKYVLIIVGWFVCLVVSLVMFLNVLLIGFIGCCWIVVFGFLCRMVFWNYVMNLFLVFFECVLVVGLFQMVCLLIFFSSRCSGELVVLFSVLMCVVVCLKVLNWVMFNFCMNLVYFLVYFCLYRVISLCEMCFGLFVSDRLFCLVVLSIQLVVLSWVLVVLLIVFLIQFFYVLCEKVLEMV